jgi:hypothetical protein
VLPGLRVYGQPALFDDAQSALFGEGNPDELDDTDNLPDGYDGRSWDEP